MVQSLQFAYTNVSLVDDMVTTSNMLVFVTVDEIISTQTKFKLPYWGKLTSYFKCPILLLPNLTFKQSVNSIDSATKEPGISKILAPLINILSKKVLNDLSSCIKHQ